jgi:hypothetical protein
MPSNQIPEDVREQCYTAIENIDWSRVEYDRPDGDEVLTAVAPLIIEWARKSQAEVTRAEVDQIKRSLDSMATGALSIYDVAKAIPHPYNALADMANHWAHDFINSARHLTEVLERAQFTPETTGDE